MSEGCKELGNLSHYALFSKRKRRSPLIYHSKVKCPDNFNRFLKLTLKRLGEIGSSESVLSLWTAGRHHLRLFARQPGAEPEGGL